MALGHGVLVSRALGSGVLGFWSLDFRVSGSPGRGFRAGRVSRGF